MTSIRDNAGLIKGLRALDVLADRAPLDAASFAQAARLSLEDAAELLEAFESEGFARRVPGGPHFVLTGRALRVCGMSGALLPAGSLALLH